MLESSCCHVRANKGCTKATKASFIDSVDELNCPNAKSKDCIVEFVTVTFCHSWDALDGVKWDDDAHSPSWHALQRCKMKSSALLASCTSTIGWLSNRLLCPELFSLGVALLVGHSKHSQIWSLRFSSGGRHPCHPTRRCGCHIQAQGHRPPIGSALSALHGKSNQVTSQMLPSNQMLPRHHKAIIAYCGHVSRIATTFVWVVRLMLTCMLSMPQIGARPWIRCSSQDTCTSSC